MDTTLTLDTTRTLANEPSDRAVPMLGIVLIGMIGGLVCAVVALVVGKGLLAAFGMYMIGGWIVLGCLLLAEGVRVTLGHFAEGLAWTRSPA